MTKTILITGASKGIGKTTALLFAAKGWNVIAAMRSPQEETELTTLENVLVTQLELRDVASIQHTLREGIARFGKIDALINNAAYGQYGLFEAQTPEQIAEQFEVNVLGTLNVIREILPHFREHKGGIIINISSGGGRVGIPMISSYVASKFALEGWTESVSYELASQNIIIKLIEPGGVETPFHDTAAKNFAANPALKSYEAFTTAFAKQFEGMHDGIATAQQVADEIYTATTDGTNQLRYLVGKDVKGWVDLRTSHSDSDYIAKMRALFNF
ncbi:SDR family oxidoreductase [Empedobacter sp. UBA7248]|uniref:SDR family oxidoreductase n=1 Tax=Empedobacter sp. UBA7248 TaxID=1946448 RepID=UPI0025C35F9A|nr:SDR family oxidoreductase [Empedobacter sp. UBA7248]